MTCIVCGKETKQFKSSGKFAKFCSKECSIEHHSRNPDRIAKAKKRRDNDPELRAKQNKQAKERVKRLAEADPDYYAKQYAKYGKANCKGPVKLTCHQCGTEFESVQAGAKYCSDGCRKVAKRDREAAITEAKRVERLARIKAKADDDMVAKAIAKVGHCQSCGSRFTKEHLLEVYCSDPCKRDGVNVLRSERRLKRVKPLVTRFRELMDKANYSQKLRLVALIHKWAEVNYLWDDALHRFELDEIVTPWIAPEQGGSLGI